VYPWSSSKSRSGKEISLKQFYAFISEPSVFILRLHALRNDFDAEIGTGAPDPSDNRLFGTVSLDVANKPKVKFEQVRLKFGKQVQAGVSCPEVVNRKFVSQTVLIPY